MTHHDDLEHQFFTDHAELAEAEDGTLFAGVAGQPSWNELVHPHFPPTSRAPLSLLPLVTPQRARPRLPAQPRLTPPPLPQAAATLDAPPQSHHGGIWSKLVDLWATGGLLGSLKSSAER